MSNLNLLSGLTLGDSSVAVVEEESTVESANRAEVLGHLRSVVMRRVKTPSGYPKGAGDVDLLALVSFAVTVGAIDSNTADACLRSLKTVPFHESTTKKKAFAEADAFFATLAFDES
jgi:hypothetical protein